MCEQLRSGSRGLPSFCGRPSSSWLRPARRRRRCCDCCESATLQLQNQDLEGMRPHGVAFLPAVGLTIEAATEVTSELERAMASLMPQLNPALVGPTRAELAALLADPATT